MATATAGAQTHIGDRRRMCTLHHDHEVTMVCIECSNGLVCPLCIATTHNGHQVCKIDDAVSRKKAAMAEILFTISTGMFRTKKSLFRLTEEQHKSNAICESNVAKIRKRKQYLKDKIDEAGDKLEDMCVKENQRNGELLQGCRETLDSWYDEMNEYHSLFKSVIESESRWNILDLNNVISSSLQPPFVNHENVTSSELTESNKSVDFGPLLGTLVSPKISDYSEKNSHYDGPADPKVRPLPPLPRSQRFTEVCQINSDVKRIRHVCPVADEKAWITWLDEHNHFTKHIFLVPKNRSKVLDVVLKTQVTDVTSSSDGSALLSCYDKTIRSINITGSNSILFFTLHRPTGICVDGEGNIVVTHRDEGKIIIYGNENFGNIINSLSRSTKTGAAMRTLPSEIQYPEGIACSKKSGDFAVIDTDKHVRVVVLDQKLGYRFQYTGSTSEDHGGQTQFGPNGVCFDTAGNLVITDGRSLSLVVLSCDGDYLYKFSMASLDAKPSGIGIDKKGLIWVGFTDGKIKVFKHNSILQK